MQQKVVVLDVDPRLLPDGYIFTEDCRKTSPGMGIFYHLNILLQKAGIQTITATTYLSDTTAYQNYNCYLVSDMQTPNTDQLLAIGVRPAILYSLESPNVAVYFYANLKKLSAKYSYTFLFEGFRRFTNPATQFRALHWPNVPVPLPDLTDWENRGFLTMVAANKHKYTAGSLQAKLYTYYLKHKNAYPHNHDLYQKRLQAILYFSRNPGFRLYGTGWHEQNNLPDLYFNAAQKAGATPVTDKLETLNKFKYSLCFENCSYPSYITEKVFDCFFSGTIPVYLGAPDITAYIPANCFIDFRNFNDFRELEVHLQELTTQQAYDYLSAARAFLESDAFTTFTEENVAARFAAALLDVR
ncbi:glycosyltransferase family 10 [Pontibacter sp. H259]|uniref:glycosyltransferase family 10 domain-containing protein n=1 Tax=Pontibacter sp. H259 TaxID=3133421 RepID=UPI0030C2AFEA